MFTNDDTCLCSLSSLLLCAQQAILSGVVSKSDIVNVIDLALDLAAPKSLTAPVNKSAAPTIYNIVKQPPSSGISSRLQLARENLGLSEADLARQLNTYSDHISDWECGITEPPASMIIPLANALKCDPLWLLTGEATRQSPATPDHQSQSHHSEPLRSDASDHASHHARNLSQA